MSATYESLLIEVEERISYLHSQLIDALRLKWDLEQKMKEGTQNQPKLTKEQVRKMKTMWDSGDYNLTQLAEEFDVHRSTIQRTIAGVYHKD